MRLLLLALPLTVALAACDASDEPAKGTDVSINASDKDGGSVNITANGDSGDVGVKVPGFDAKMRLPKMLLKDSDFDIDGVKLYPGSTVNSVNVDANGLSDKGGKGEVKVGFSAPAETAKVSQWFRDAFTKAGVTVTGDGNMLSGKTKDGDPFSVTLTDAGGNKSSGTITISG
jgi:hypothetical protein